LAISLLTLLTLSSINLLCGSNNFPGGSENKKRGGGTVISCVEIKGKEEGDWTREWGLWRQSRVEYILIKKSAFSREMFSIKLQNSYIFSR
jgi:hypothetical protein